MAKMVKRDRECLYCVEENDVSSERIFFDLIHNRRECVYVLNGERLTGIITIGDCERYFHGERELINKSFRYLKEKDADNIVDIVANFPQINSVPIVDNEGKLLYDFKLLRCLEDMLIWEKGYVRWLRKVFNECGIKSIIFINAIEMARSVRKGFEKFGIKEISVRCQDEYDDSSVATTLYVDDDYFRTCIMKTRDVSYQIVNTEFFWKLAAGGSLYMKKLDNFCMLINNTYKKIAVYNSGNLLSERIIGGLTDLNTDFTIIDKMDIVFDLKKGEYRLGSDIEQEYDVIVSCGFDIVYWPIVYGEKRIYNLVAAFRGACGVFLKEGRIQEVDIINNVLPEMADKGVKVVLWETPTNLVGIERIVISDLLRYGLNRSVMKVYGRTENYLKVPYNFDKGYLDYEDISMPGFNIEVGERKTITRTVSDMVNKVYFFGGCMVYGNMVGDSETIASYFGDLLHNYSVHNYGSWEWMLPWKMREPKYGKGDIVILLVTQADIYRANGYKVNSVLRAYDEFKDCMEDVAWDIYGHCNGKVNKNIAEVLYDICIEEGILEG